MTHILNVWEHLLLGLALIVLVPAVIMVKAFERFENKMDLRAGFDPRPQMHRDTRLTYELDPIARRKIQERWLGRSLTSKGRKS